MSFEMHGDVLNCRNGVMRDLSFLMRVKIYLTFLKVKKD